MEESKQQQHQITFFGMNFTTFFKDTCCCGQRDDGSVASFDNKHGNQNKRVEKKKKNMDLEQKQYLLERDQLQHEEQSQASNQESWFDVDEYVMPPDTFTQESYQYAQATTEDPNSYYEEYYTKEPIDFDTLKNPTSRTDKEESSRSELSLSSHSKKIAKKQTRGRKKNANVKNDVQKAKGHTEGSKKRNKRQPWLPHEDAKVLELIAKHGQSWALIASLMEGRTGKQIRDRFLNKLRPGVKSGDWKPAEDQLLLSLYYQIGNKWSKIATHMPGRTEGQVKNRFYSHVKKKLLKLEGSDITGTSPDLNILSPTNAQIFDTSHNGSPTANGQLRQAISPTNQQNFQIQPHYVMQQPQVNLNQQSFGHGNPPDYTPNSQNIFNRPPVQLADPTDMISFENNDQPTGESNHSYQKVTSSLYTEHPSSPDSYFANFSTNHSYKSEKDLTDALDNVGVFFEKQNSTYSNKRIEEDCSPTSDTLSTQEKLERIELLNQRRRNLEVLLQKTMFEIERMNPGVSFDQNATNYIH